MTFKVEIDRDPKTSKFFFNVYEYGSETNVAFTSGPVYRSADEAQEAILTTLRETPFPDETD